ncbi:MAG: SDR family NAD(P)-dependent oxidoreductase, partial [Bacteroidota bacterium]|nr:SDR family NAD(P)-dependent oxidoreductase [Bacteroidota bacterium]
MQQGLKGQVALVTGGATGLGLAIAKALAKEGVRLALLDRDAGALTRLKANFPFDAWRCDIASEEEVRRTV